MSYTDKRQEILALIAAIQDQRTALLETANQLSHAISDLCGLADTLLPTVVDEITEVPSTRRLGYGPQVEAIVAHTNQRKCGTCHKPGHDSRNCDMRDTQALTTRRARRKKGR